MLSTFLIKYLKDYHLLNFYHYNITNMSKLAIKNAITISKILNKKLIIKYNK